MSIQWRSLGVYGLVVAGAITVPAPVLAASATATLSVSATVANNCTITTSSLAFGAYEPVGANTTASLDTSSTVTVACTKGASATIGLNLGTNASGGTRRLADGTGGYLSYEIYQDSGRTTVWGNGGADLLAPGVAPSKAPRNFTVYGRIAGSQDVPAGSYTDTVTATVNF